MSQANFYSIHFLKVRYFPGKIDNKLLPGVFLEASLPLQYTFKTVLRPTFFVARLTASRPKKLVPLAKKLVKLDSAVVSMVFQELCHLVAIFLDCSSSCPCRSPLISKAHSLQNDFVVFFRLGVVYENREAFFSPLEAFASRGKQ